MYELGQDYTQPIGTIEAFLESLRNPLYPSSSDRYYNLSNVPTHTPALEHIEKWGNLMFYFYHKYGHPKNVLGKREYAATLPECASCKKGKGLSSDCLRANSQCAKTVGEIELYLIIWQAIAHIPRCSDPGQYEGRDSDNAILNRMFTHQIPYVKSFVEGAVARAMQARILCASSIHPTITFALQLKSPQSYGSPGSVVPGTSPAPSPTPTPSNGNNNLSTGGQNLIPVDLGLTPQLVYLGQTGSGALVVSSSEFIPAQSNVQTTALAQFQRLGQALPEVSEVQPQKDYTLYFALGVLGLILLSDRKKRR